MKIEVTEKCNFPKEGYVITPGEQFEVVTYWKDTAYTVMHAGVEVAIPIQRAKVIEDINESS